MPPKKTEQTFETAIARVEGLASQMENGEMPLDELITAYEEGLGLIRFCGERLDEAEKRLQTITRDAAGKVKGIAPLSEEIQPSTPPGSSATQEDSGAPEGPSGSVRLF